jgi:hypothetical protein
MPSTEQCRLFHSLFGRGELEESFSAAILSTGVYICKSESIGVTVPKSIVF